MEIKRVSAGQKITVGEITILPIIQTFMVCRSVKTVIAGAGEKSVTGLVVISPKGRYAINIAGEEVPLEQYAEDVPEVRELLEKR